MMQFTLIAVCLFGVAFQDGEGVSVKYFEDEPSEVVAYADGRKVNISQVARNRVLRKEPEILQGSGYSEDLRQIVDQKCFKVSISGTSDAQNIIRTAKSSSFSELQTELGADVTARVGWEMFSLSAKSSYLRSIRDDKYSMSLNYFQYASNEVTLQVEGYGEDALNQFGKDAYKKNKNRFGITCGDNYLSSFRQGALLVMGLSMKFNSSEDRETFSGGAGVSFGIGDIVSASTKIQSTAKQSSLVGSVTVEAYQLGGEPSQLSKILGGDEKTPFFFTSCNLNAMDSCQKAAASLMKYATDDFRNQYNFDKNIGLTSFGAAFTKYGSIKNLNLTPPPSLVTPEIRKYRFYLAQKLRECEAITQKLNWFISSKSFKPKVQNLVDNINTIRSRAEENCQLLMAPHHGSAECFEKPDECLTVIKPMFDSELHNFTLIDILYLENGQSLGDVLSSDSFTQAIRNEEKLHNLHRFD